MAFIKTLGEHLIFLKDIKTYKTLSSILAMEYGYLDFSKKSFNGNKTNLCCWETQGCE